jgi:hypothetical protein
LENGKNRDKDERIPSRTVIYRDTLEICNLFDVSRVSDSKFYGKAAESAMSKSYDKCVDNSNNIYNFASQNRKYLKNTDIILLEKINIIYNYKKQLKRCLQFNS